VTNGLNALPVSTL